MACWKCFVAEEEEKVGRWKFSLTVESAKHLPNVRKLKIMKKTRAYAKIDIGSDKTKITRQTDIDINNGLNPIWNHSINYEIADPSVRTYGMAVTIRLYTKRTRGSDRYIGMYHTTMKELFEEPSLRDGCTKLAVDIKTKKAGKTKGKLHIAYRFRDFRMVRKSYFIKKASGSGAWFGKNVAIQLASRAIVFAIFLSV